MTITVSDQREGGGDELPDLSMMTTAPRARTNDTEKNMFKPTMKQRHLDAIVRMSAESGRDPQEVYQELLDQATSTDAPPNVAPKLAAPPTPSPAPQTAPQGKVRPDGTRIAKVVVIPHPEGPRLGETIAQAKRRENGETEDDASASDDETSDAPPEKMKGGKPNPLTLPSSKQWAGRKDDSAPTASPKTLEQDSTEMLRRKYLKRG